MIVEDTNENFKKCICKSCPSQNECMNNNKGSFYCARGESKCDIARKGCICGACPITSEFKLKNYYYCLKDKAE